VLVRAGKPPGVIEVVAAARLCDGVGETEGGRTTLPRPTRAARPRRVAVGSPEVPAEVMQALARACKPPDVIEAAAATQRSHLTGAVMAPSKEELAKPHAQATAPAKNISCM
jgi:hypothetical protein